MATWGPLVDAGPTTRKPTKESEVMGPIALPGWVVSISMGEECDAVAPLSFVEKHRSAVISERKRRSGEQQFFLLCLIHEKNLVLLL